MRKLSKSCREGHKFFTINKSHFHFLTIMLHTIYHILPAKTMLKLAEISIHNGDKNNLRNHSHKKNVKFNNKKTSESDVSH